MSTPFIEENDQTRARREHLGRIRELVGNAYPSRFARKDVTGSPEGEDTITSVVRAYAKYAPGSEEGGRPAAEQLEEANEQLKDTVVRVAGRLAVPPRVMGKTAFVHLSDGRERLQIYVRRQEARAVSNDSGEPVEEPESGWALFQLLDHGDFVGVEGHLFVTKTGELSVYVRTLQFLSKALVPMPDKMHGISDPEVRQRQRYADLIASSLKIEREGEVAEAEGGERRELTTREVFERRSRLITAMRRHLDDHGYIEVETPMLSPIASGAAARPFKTHHNALDIDLYARVAPELYLKRLVVGGFERVYELNRNFRNEGISTRHNPEFTMLEFYSAYMDAAGMMDFCEELLTTVIEQVVGSLKVYSQWGGRQPPLFDFARPWPRLTMKEAIAGSNLWKVYAREGGPEFNPGWLEDPRRLDQLVRFHDVLEKSGRDLSIMTPDMIKSAWALAEPAGGNLFSEPAGDDGALMGAHVARLFEAVGESRLNNPTFITDFPKAISPLSKSSPEDPSVAERFELYIAGMECANGFSELNDPEEQYQRFLEQSEQRERGDDEAMQMDLDYVRALSYGMPPAAGIGIGIDRITMLLTNRRSIRDVILFPHMRPQRAAADEPAADSSAHAADGQDSKQTKKLSP